MKRLGSMASCLACLGSVTLGCAAPAQETSEEENAGQTAEAFGEPTDTVPRNPGPHTAQWDADAIIDAPRDVVWNLLMDLPHYKDWNPWITSAEGTVTPGAHVHVNAVMGPVTEPFDHVVMTVTPQSFFCWRDSGWNSWFVYGQRCRWLEETPDGKTHFHQQVLVDGALDVVAKVMNGPCLQAGINNETQALKTTAEAHAHP